MNDFEFFRSICRRAGLAALLASAVTACGAAADDVATGTVTAASTSSPCGPQPQGLVCNTTVCTAADGWIDWPLPAGTACSTPAGVGECDGGEIGPPNLVEPLALGACIITSGSLDPRYYVLSLIYSPPGNNNGFDVSSVSYEAGSTLAIETEATESFEEGLGVSAAIELPLLGELDFGNDWTETEISSDALAMEKSGTRRIDHSGPPTDGIDHNDDELYLWLNPRVNFAKFGGNAVWTLALNPDTAAGSNVDIQYVKIGWLNGTWPMPPGVANALAAHGITPGDDYAALLSVDEFAGGRTAIDPKQFVATGTTFPYEPPALPNGTPDSFTLTLANSQTATSTATKIKDVTTSASAPVPLPDGGPKLAVSGRWTWSHTNRTSRSVGSNETASVTITGPSYGYTGPTDVAVYYDTIYRTFLFAFITYTTPWITGSLRLGEKPLVHEGIDLAIGDANYHTVSTASGQYRFFNPPHGRGKLTVKGVTREVVIGDRPVRVDFSM